MWCLATSSFLKCLMNIESFREFCLSLPYATEDMPFDDTVVVFRLKQKIFAAIFLDKPDLVVMKCNAEKATELRERYSAVESAYHWNKKYWNQIWLNRDVNDQLLKELTTHAWHEVNLKLPKRDRIAL